MRFPLRAVVLALSFIVPFTSCSQEARPSRAEATPAVAAVTAAARIEEIPDLLSLTGTIQPFSRVVLSARVMGVIRSIAVREGALVRAGQVLVRIDDTDLSAAVAQAEAAVEAARAAEENAAVHRDRMRDLESRQAATRKNREDAEMGYSVAAAQRRQAESALAGARATLAYATITSPVGGIVAGRSAEEGDMAAPGMPILTLEEVARMKVEAALPETEAASIAQGTPVTVSFDAGGLAPRRAEVFELLPTADPATRTLLVRVLLDNADRSLRSGTFARLGIERGTRKALRVPRAALLERGALTGIYVAIPENGGTLARLRWVRTGRSDGEQVEILGGLAEGERYVTSVTPDLTDGSPLTAGR